jgi:hypothetical protein
MVVEVVPKTSRANDYATIVRACLTACNACRRLKDNKTQQEFIRLMEQATKSYIQEQ